MTERERQKAVDAGLRALGIPADWPWWQQVEALMVEVERLADVSEERQAVMRGFDEAMRRLSLTEDVLEAASAWKNAPTRLSANRLQRKIIVWEICADTSDADDDALGSR